MRQRDLERLAKAIRERAGLGADAFVDAVDVTTRIVGSTSIVFDPTVGDATFLRRRRDEHWEIVFGPDATDIRFRLLHETAHVVIDEEQIQMSREEEERAANYIAAAVMAPPDLVRRAHEHYGEKLAPIARTFGMTLKTTRLRLGEVHILLRTQGALPWTDAPVSEIGRLRGLAKAAIDGAGARRVRKRQGK